MLFQKIFNWIKYKTLPASFLFRNRLYVERDSKNKRIFSNFGAHFKGSKWSYYTSFAIKPFFKSKYFKYTVQAVLYILVLVGFYFYNKYYIKLPPINGFFYLIWSCADCTQYYLMFAMWWVFVGLLQIFNFIYYLSTFNNFSFKRAPSYLNRAFSEFDLPEESAYKKKLITKEDINFYSNMWLSLTASSAKSQILENLFEENLKLSEVAKNGNFFRFNGLTTDFFNKISSEVTSYRVHRKLSLILIKNCDNDYNKLYEYISNTSFFTNNAAACLTYFVAQPTYFELASRRSNSTYYLKHRYDWNLYSVISEMQKSAPSKKNKTGLFFLKSCDHKELLDLALSADEFKSFELHAKILTNRLKTYRWLYKYSILHRKSLKFVNKIASGKKTAFSSSYDKNYTHKKIWQNEINFTKINLLNSFLYTSIDRRFEPLAWEAEPHEDTLISFYENSYAWVFKKFFFFNSLSANTVWNKFNRTFVSAAHSLDFKQKNLQNFHYALSLANKSSNRYWFLYSFNELNPVVQEQAGIVPALLDERVCTDLHVSYFDSNTFVNEIVKANSIADVSISSTSALVFSNFVLNQPLFLQNFSAVVKELRFEDSSNLNFEEIFWNEFFFNGLFEDDLLRYFNLF